MEINQSPPCSPQKKFVNTQYNSDTDLSEIWGSRWRSLGERGVEQGLKPQPCDQGICVLFTVQYQLLKQEFSVCTGPM